MSSFAFFPPDVSTTGHWIDQIFYLALALTGIAFLAVVLTLAFFLIQYRARPGHKAYHTHGDSPRARWLTIGLALVVFFVIDVNLAYHDHYAWEAVFGTPISMENAVRIEVMPEQFVWNFRYAGADGKFQTADDVTSVNQMHIPVKRPVVLALRSKDVIHSFFIPNFRVKQDVVPGMVTMLSFEAAKEGTYDIACAEHCGLGHYRMRGILTVKSEEGFQTWLANEAARRTSNPAWGWDWEAKI